MRNMNKPLCYDGCWFANPTSKGSILDLVDCIMDVGIEIESRVEGYYGNNLMATATCTNIDTSSSIDYALKDRFWGYG